MTSRRFAPLLLSLVVALGLLPLSPASAAINKPPRIKKAVMKDTDGDGMANKVVLTYNEKIKHRLDTSRFPFKVQGYAIKKVNAARRTTKLVIVLKENPNAPLKPASIRYTRTRKQPVLDLKKKQAAKQLLTRNIIGLSVSTPPPPPPGQYTLSVAKSGDGSVTSSPVGIDCATTCTSDSASFDQGSEVNLTATPGPEEAPEVTWSGDGCSASTATTCTVTMDANKSISVTFAAAGSRTIVVTNSGDGTGTVTSNPAGVNCGATCVASFDETVALVKLTATPAKGSKLASWGGDATCAATSTTCDILMDGNKSVTVTFELLPLHMLTVAIDNAGTGSGTVTSNPAGITCGSDCNHEFSEGTTVTLTATPAEGSEFAGWGGAAGCATLTCDIPMNAAKNVTAKFNTAGTAPTKYTIALSVTGAGTVSCMVGVTAVSCASEFDPGTIVTLTATATDPLATTFSGWSGNCSGILPTCVLTMDANKTVAATFTTATTGGLL